MKNELIPNDSMSEKYKDMSWNELLEEYARQRNQFGIMWNMGQGDQEEAEMAMIKAEMNRRR